MRDKTPNTAQTEPSAKQKADAPAQPKSPHPASRGRWWRWPLKAALGSISLLFTAVLLLGLAAWIWGGHEGSLANTLQTLVRIGLLQRADGVQGTLSRGGRVQQLEAQFGNTHIHLQGLQLAWQAPELLQGRLYVQKLTLGTLKITLRPEPKPEEKASTAPRSLALPLAVQIDAISLGQIQLYTQAQAQQPSWQAQDITGSYQYQKGQHQLQLHSLRMFDGQYQASAQLAGKHPFALRAQADAQLQLPNMPEAPALLAHLDVEGNLLDMRAQLRAENAPIPRQAQTATLPASKATAAEPTQLHLQARVQPWGSVLLQDVQGEVAHLNLASFAPALPQTNISGSLKPQLTSLNQQEEAAGDSLDIDLRNSAAAPWDLGGLPVDRIQAKLIWQAQALQIPELTLSLGAGRLQAQGQWQAQNAAWQAQAKWQQLDLAQLYSTFAPSRLQGQAQASSPGQASVQATSADQAKAKTEAAPIDFSLTAENQTASGHAAHLLDIRSAKLKGRWQAQSLALETVDFQTQDAQLHGQLHYQLAQQKAQLDLQLQAPGLTGKAKGDISASQGQGELELNLSNAKNLSTWLGRWPGLALPQLDGQGQGHMRWQGGWHNPSLQAQLDLPELRISPAAKTSSATSKARGNAQAPADAKAATSPEQDLQLQQVQLRAQGPLRALDLHLQAQAKQGQHQASAALDAQFGLQLADGQAPLRLQLQTQLAQLRFGDDSSPLETAWLLEQAAPIQLKWQAGYLQLAAGQLRLTAPQALRVGPQRSLLLEWNASELRQGAQGGISYARSSGQLQGLSHRWLEALSGASLAQMGLGGEIALDAHWDVRLDRQLYIHAGLERRSGDFYLRSGLDKSDTITAPGSASSAPVASPSKPRQNAGVQAAWIKLSGSSQELSLQALWDSSHAGRIQAQLSSRLQRQADGSWTWPENSPVRGQVQADLPTLGLWSALAPTGWRVHGQMAFNADISGTRLAPDLRGQLRIQDLAMRSVLDGIELKNGQLQARFSGTQMAIERFYIEGAEGQLQAQGKLAWEAGLPSADIQLQAQRLRASNRPDRRVTITGQVHTSLQNRAITLTGELGIDEALILLADSNKPSLGSDVRIVRSAKPAGDLPTVPTEAQLASEEAASQAAAKQALAPFTQAESEAQPWALKADITLDMGDKLRVRGLGLDTHLAGKLQLHAVSEQTTSKGHTALRPEITGTLHTVGGEYRAYGQWLEIEEGLIRFTGPYNNPQLDILAIRPRTEERVGVRITGPTSNPRAALYSENAMPDSEKLAWLILGREGSNGGAEAAMLQQAAVALLGSGSSSSGLAQTVGLDEIGYRSAETNSDGTVRESSISIGKRLSRRLYLSYERSLSGALGTLYVFYDISRRFTFRAQSNEEASAIDLIFTRRYQSVLPGKRAALEAAAAQERTEQIQNETAKRNPKLEPTIDPLGSKN